MQLRIEIEILLPVVPDSFKGLLAKVSQVGLRREFVVGRLLSSADAAMADGEVPDQSNDQRLTEESGSRAGARLRMEARPTLRRSSTARTLDGGSCRTFQDAEAT